MSRTLGFFQLVIAIAVIAVLVAIGIVNMYLLARHRRSCFTVSFHLSSLFAVCGLASYMLSTVVFVLPLADRYRTLSHHFLILWGFSVLGGAAAVFVLRKRRSDTNLSQNIARALAGINDVVFVVDRDGFVTHINHPERYRDLFGDIGTMDELVQFMNANCSPVWVQEPNALTDTACRELFFSKTDTYDIFWVSPITVSGNHIGYTAVLEDVTTVKRGETKLREQNEYLRQANARLANYVKVAGALEAEKERLQILEHVQVTLINDIEQALTAVRQIKKYSFQDDTYRSAAKGLAQQLRAVYNEVRKAVGAISGKEVQQ